KPLGNFEVKWKEATGTKWDDVKNTNKETKDSPLDWTKIKEQLKSNELESEAIKDIGMKKWTISKEDNVKNYKEDTIEINKNLRTWLISAKKGSGKNFMSYYYTYDDVQKIEIWAYSNPKDEQHNKKSIFVRTYNKPNSYLQRSPDNSGFTLKDQVFTDSSISTSDEFDFSDGFDFPVGAPDGDGYEHGLKTNKNGYDFLEYSKDSNSLHPGEDWNGVDDKGNPVGNADFGDSVYAISNGRVVAAKSIEGNLGNVIVIEHRLQDGSTVWSQYAHLNEMLVKEGDNVKRGKEIGTIGKSRGISHLHFEIRKSDLSPSAWPKGQSEEEVLKNYYDPSDFINSHRPQTEHEAEGNANVMLVIDRSGSMYGLPISNARNSAQQFIDQMGSEDKAGVVSFSSYASKDYSLTALTDDERELIKKKINSISASGSTAIGSGLELALNNLQENGDKNSPQAIVLLSDGQHNTGKHPDKVIPSLQEKKIKVYTIGLGSYIDENLLRNTAEETDGMYFFTPTESQLNQIYSDIGAEILDLDTVKKFTVNMVTDDIVSTPVKI
ncbi:MAG TPA: VWA domain-containing protein, partial [Chitinispirillaceae bacterium]|nr:VWA domain-containing protein [Chitinispirillaceae bacterium]